MIWHQISLHYLRVSLCMYILVHVYFLKFDHIKHLTWYLFAIFLNPFLFQWWWQWINNWNSVIVVKVYVFFFRFNIFSAKYSQRNLKSETSELVINGVRENAFFLSMGNRNLEGGAKYQFFLLRLNVELLEVTASDVNR